MTAKLLLWYFYKGKSDSVEICQWRWQCKYPNKSDFHWADLLIIKFLITCSSCFIPIGEDWKNVGCLPRDQLSLSGLKQTSNLITNILSPYSSTIQANKPFIYAFFVGGKWGVSIIKSECWAWQLQKEGFPHLLCFLSCQLSLWANMSNRFQLILVLLSVLFIFVKNVSYLSN